MKDQKNINVVGAGPGGLTVAMLLAKRGFNVNLFEKESTAGGRNAALVRNGYKFDLGPTFLMMKFILDEVFEEAGCNIDDYLDFVKLEPGFRHACALDVGSFPKYRAAVAAIERA